MEKGVLALESSFKPGIGKWSFAMHSDKVVSDRARKSAEATCTNASGPSFLSLIDSHNHNPFEITSGVALN